MATEAARPPVPQELAIIAAPRSGTNFFCDALGAFPEAANLFELFNPRGTFGLERFPPLYAHLSGRLATRVSAVSDPALIQAARRDPVAFLKDLEDGLPALGKRFFSYKIFPGQIADAALQQILGDRRKRILLIARCRIDAFISFKKAMARDSWVNEDTSGVIIEAGLEEFLSWGAAQDQWYAAAEEQLRHSGQRYVALTYDADINVPKPALVEKQYLTLRALGFGVTFPQGIEPPRFRRQDKPAGPFTKIANGEELKKQLQDKGLLGAYALKSPLLPLPLPAQAQV